MVVLRHRDKLVVSRFEVIMSDKGKYYFDLRFDKGDVSPPLANTDESRGIICLTGTVTAPHRVVTVYFTDAGAVVINNNASIK